MADQPVAVVTGVSRHRGIAAAICRRLLADGWRVVMSGWPAYDDQVPWGTDAGAMASIIDAPESGGRATGLELDMADPTSVAPLFDFAESKFAAPTALVVVHTRDTGGGLFDLSQAEFDLHYAVNARATFLLIAEFARRFSGIAGRGRVVTFTTGLPQKGSIAYAASKGAVEWLTVSAAAELADRGITANVVNPGPNDTGWMSEEVRAEILRVSPLGRVGRPEDAAELVRFLCSEGAGWITGQVLTSDGGWSRLRP